MNKIKIMLWGKEFNLDITYDCYSNEKILKSQETAVQDFSKAVESIDSSLEEVKNYCLSINKEEIGSEGATGAKSRFMEYCVRELMAAWEPQAVFGDIMQNTRALSADVNAALDPDYPDVHERLNSALLGYGPAMSKFTGHRGKYESSDATAQYVAFIRGVLNRESIPWQLVEMGRVDNGGGGTVAMHLANYGMDVIDMGPSVLSMHSPFELSSVVDVYASYKAYQAFYEG